MITIAGYDITLIIFLLLGIVVAAQHYHIQELHRENRRITECLSYEFEKNWNENAK